MNTKSSIKLKILHANTVELAFKNFNLYKFKQYVSSSAEDKIVIRDISWNIKLTTYMYNGGEKLIINPPKKSREGNGIYTGKCILRGITYVNAIALANYLNDNFTEYISCGEKLSRVFAINTKFLV